MTAVLVAVGIMIVVAVIYVMWISGKWSRIGQGKWER